VSFHNENSLSAQAFSVLQPNDNADSASGSSANAGAFLNSASPSVILIGAAGIKPEPIAWLWYGYIAKGKLHILAGKPSTGKTTLCIELAAIISSGGTFPDGTKATPGNVLIWTSEDGIADTLVPRLVAANADRERVYFVDGKKEADERKAFDPATDMPLLISVVKRVGGCSLLIIDPIVSAIQGDSHKNAEVRRGLHPVVVFAEKTGCAVVGITHLSKGTQGQDPIDRITGSLAFGAAARVVLLAFREKNNGEPGPGRRVLARAKSNIGPDDGGFFYEIKPTLPVPGIVTSKITWLGIAEGSAADIIGRAEDTHDAEQKTALDEARQFLRETLAEKALSAKEVFKAGADIGISKAAIKRAKLPAGVRSFKEKGGKGRWMWCINDPAKHEKADQGDQGDQGDHVLGVDTVDPLGPPHLQVDQEAQLQKHEPLDPLDPLAHQNGVAGLPDAGKEWVEEL
jgi:putative DNA primase/helicase